jgi:hypothetical protein
MNAEHNNRARDHEPPPGRPHVTADGTAHARSDAPAALPIEVADDLILRLNAVAYTLASCASLIGEQAAARIGQAIADLDRVIEDLRAGPAEPGAAGRDED